MLTLALPLLLAVVPCTDLEADLHLIEEASKSRPDELPSLIEDLEGSAGGMPLRPAGNLPAEQLASDVAARLRAACELQEATARSQAPLPASEPDRLRSILDRAEFAQARQRNTDLLQRIIRQLEDWIMRLFQARGAEGYSATARAVVLGLALAVLLGGLLRFLRSRRPAAAQPSSREETTAPLELDSPREHLQRAQTTLASDTREAIRQGLLALLSTLEERQLARPDRVKTNRELAAELPDRGAPALLVQEVERLVRWYDRTFYSLSPVPPEEAARFVADVERLHASPPGGVA
ncbi:MAG: DUF4129 domain-containing protein [Myxococcaceae bacterium]|nr:DUF4129 domain-containing protein [Myxococcaceae bacterium]